MANVKQIQIGENVYDIHDVTARASLAGKQDTISDLSTIRSNASNAKSKSDTAISRLNNFKISVTKFFASGVNIPAVSTARLIGAHTSVTCLRQETIGSGLWGDDYESPTDGVWLGTFGWQAPISTLVAFVDHDANCTYLHIRNLTTSAVRADSSNTWSREGFIVLG